MKVQAALTLALLAAASAPTVAQDRASQEAACRSDTRRFCRSVDPDTGTGGILTCLKQNRARLSKGCRSLLESHGQ